MGNESCADPGNFFVAVVRISIGWISGRLKSWINSDSMGVLIQLTAGLSKLLCGLALGAPIAVVETEVVRLRDCSGWEGGMEAIEHAQR